MTVVSDTTAITTLIKAGEEHLLRDLFGTVLVPHAVWGELVAFHSTLPDFVTLRVVPEKAQPLPGTETLGRGEAEAIILARESSETLLITDDRKARAAASRLGIPCIGLVGLIVKAKQDGRLSSVRAELETLEKLGGLYLSNEVKTKALVLAGEASPPPSS